MGYDDFRIHISGWKGFFLNPFVERHSFVGVHALRNLAAYRAYLKERFHLNEGDFVTCGAYYPFASLGD